MAVSVIQPHRPPDPFQPKEKEKLSDLDKILKAVQIANGVFGIAADVDKIYTNVGVRKQNAAETEKLTRANEFEEAGILNDTQRIDALGSGVENSRLEDPTAMKFKAPIRANGEIKRNPEGKIQTEDVYYAPSLLSRFAKFAGAGVDISQAKQIDQSVSDKQVIAKDKTDFEKRINSGILTNKDLLDKFKDGLEAVKPGEQGTSGPIFRMDHDEAKNPLQFRQIQKQFPPQRPAKPPKAPSPGRGSGPKGKILAQTTVGKISMKISALQSLPEIIAAIEKNKESFGPINGLAIHAPWDDPYMTTAKTINSLISIQRQKYGSAMEGGVLRAEDEKKYKEMFPKMTDPPDVAVNKYHVVRSDLINQINAELDGLKKSGYDTSAYEKQVKSMLPDVLVPDQKTKIKKQNGYLFKFNDVSGKWENQGRAK